MPKGRRVWILIVSIELFVAFCTLSHYIRGLKFEHRFCSSICYRRPSTSTISVGSTAAFDFDVLVAKSLAYTDRNVRNVHVTAAKSTVCSGVHSKATSADPGGDFVSGASTSHTPTLCRISRAVVQKLENNQLDSSQHFSFGEARFTTGVCALFKPFGESCFYINDEGRDLSVSALGSRNWSKPCSADVHI